MHADGAMEARVSGTAPLTRVELIKNGSVIHSLTPSRNRGRLVRIVWGDNLYQRRAAVGLREGSIRPESGALKLVRAVNLDQAFEDVAQEGRSIRWKTAAVSGDRDGFLADVGEAVGHLHFRLDDSSDMGLIEARIPLDALRRDGYYVWSMKGNVDHPYMKKMGLDPTFRIECELVNEAGPMDETVRFQHREPLKPGDYFYLRAEQMDTNKLWTSPVWVN
jgi:hypothetical protein